MNIYNLDIDIPYNVKKILDRLKEYGSIGYVVGGCLRDYFLGKDPNDWDIATPLPIYVVKNALYDYDTFDTGIKHGTITVVINDEKYEITSFKKIEFQDDDNFMNSLYHDISHRDFTINSLAYNPEVGLIDIFNGIEDIKDGIIKCVGNPHDRFCEDPLRILRALRFSITLDFSINEWTYQQMIIDYGNVIPSYERINSEIYKIMGTEFPHTFNILYKFIQLINKGVSEYDKSLDYVIKSLVVTDKRCSVITRLALLYCCDCDNIKENLENIHMDNRTINSILNILKRKDYYSNLLYDEEKRKYETRKIIHDIGFDNAINLFDFWIARITALGIYNKFKYLKIIEQMKIDAVNIVNNNECYSLDKLDISGNDLIDIGYKQGKEIGEVLNLLLDEVMKNQYKNKKNWLIKWAEDLKQSTNNK